MPQLESYAVPEALLQEPSLADIRGMQPDLLEAALRMEVTARCQRAYVHDLNNSLQPVFAAVEMLTRAATVGTHTPVERVVEFAKLAVSQHKLTMTDLIGTLIGPDAPATDIDLNDMLQNLTAFLTHDASQRRVKLSLHSGAAVQVHAQVSKLRLMFLALLTDAIDALTMGGSIDVEAVQEPDSVTICVTDSRPSPDETLLSELQQHGTSRAMLLMPVLHRMATQQGGCVETAPAGRHSVRIRLPLPG